MSSTSRAASRTRTAPSLAQSKPESSTTGPNRLRASRTGPPVAGDRPKRAALGDKSNVDSHGAAYEIDAGLIKPAGVHLRATSHDGTLKHKASMSSSTTTGARRVIKASGGVTSSTSNPGGMTASTSASASLAGTKHARAPSSSAPLQAGAARVRGSTFSSSNARDAPMECDDAQTFYSASRGVAQSQPVASSRHAAAAKMELDGAAPLATEDDEDMSEVESDWRSSGAGSEQSSKTDGDSLGDPDSDTAGKHVVHGATDDLLSDAESEGLDAPYSLDPDGLVTLDAEADTMAQLKVRAICERYEAEVVRPAALKASAERADLAARGQLCPRAAALDDELALMGLDPEEVRDTSMVAEYAKEIFEYMEKCERETMANPNYMSFQGEIEWHMRATLVDWLLQVHMRYHMLPETLWIAINIVDRFLSVRVVSLAKLQLVGVTAMFVAAKYEEILAPSVDEFVYMTESGYSRDEILKGERIILSTLDFNVSSYCSPYSWVRRISKADDYDIQTRTLSKFLMEVTLLDHRFLRARPSLIAAVGMFLAKRMLAGEWDDGFVYYSRFAPEQLVPGANLLLEKLLEEGFGDHFVCRKYANKKFLRASVFARDWARRNHASLCAQQQADGEFQPSQ